MRVKMAVLLMGLLALLPLSSAAYGLNLPQLETTLPKITLAVPQTPDSLRANVWPGSLSVTLQWTDRSSTESGFTLERAYWGEPFLQIATVAANTTYASDTPEQGRLCFYRVKAFNTSGSSEYSDTLEFRSAPHAPVEVTAEPGPGPEDSITIRWEKGPDSDNVISRYSIERNVVGKPDSTVILTPPGLNLFYTDRTPVHDVKYEYRVRAHSDNAYSPPSDQTAFKLLNKPASIVAAVFPGSSHMSVSWADSSINEDGFLVEYIQEGSSNYQPTEIRLGSNVTNTSFPVYTGANWYVQVSAYREDGSQSVGTVAYWKAPEQPELPTPPSQFKAVGGIGKITLSWNYTNSTGLRFTVERKTGNGAFEPIAGVGFPSVGNTSTFHDENVETGKSYTYRVMANNDFHSSPYSPEVTATPFAVSQLEISTNLVVFKVGSSQMVVDGNPADIDSGSSVKPLVSEKGRTLVPIRALVEAYGGTVDWNSETRTITILLNGRTLILTIGQDEASVDGRIVPLDEPPRVVDGRTLIPLRFVSENAGLTVDWNQTTQEITIHP